MKKLLSALLAILSLLHIQAATIIPSDTQNTQQSFPFAIAAHAYCQSLGAFFVGAREEVKDNEYALAGCTAAADRFFPFAKKTVNLNYMPHQNNPTTGQAIRYATVAGTSPVVVTHAEPHKIYCYHDFRNLNEIMVSSLEDLRDSNSRPSAGIIGLGSGTGNQSQLNFYVALQNEQGVFGESGSGIVPVQLELEDVEVEGKLYNTAMLTQGQVLSVTKESPFLAVGQPLQDFLNNPQHPVVFHTDVFGVLYTGVSVIGGEDTRAGARAVFVGANEIVPASALEEDSIIGGIGAHKQVSIHALKTLFTSTSLQYLIVQGGIGTIEETRNTIYALPLVNYVQTGFVYTGMLAKKNAEPLTFFAENQPRHFKGRAFVEPATQPGDLYSSQDIQVCVGNKSQLPGDITAVWPVGDAVYVTTCDGLVERGGIFYSQALFDDKGRIKGWTNWQRTSAPMAAFGGAVNGAQSSMLFLEGSHKDSVGNVRKTEWNAQNDHPLRQFVQNFFPAENFGVQGITEITSNHAVLEQHGDERHALLILSGNKRVALLQTACNQNGMLEPTTLYNDHNTRTFTGDVLDELGAITTSALLFNDTQAWVVIGGNGGVAVLCHEDGSGVPVPFCKNFKNFDDTLRFKKLAISKDVKKIIAINNTLYILTKKQLLRVIITPHALNTMPECTLLAQADELHKAAWLEDVIISGDLALLATSKGLWRVGDGRSCKTAQDSQQMNWTPVLLRESPGPVIQLFAVSPTGNEIDVATHNNGGQIYALSAYMGYHQARVYRLSIHTGAVTESTVRPFPDYFVKDIPTFYLNIGDYKNRLFTEGASIMLSRSRYNPTNTDAYIQSLPPYELHKNMETVETGSIHFVTANTRALIRAAVVQAHLRSKKSLGIIKRLSSDGSLLIAGNDGLELHT